MKLMYRLMLSFFAIIVTLMIIVSISFINVTNNTLYHNTWQQLKSYSDSFFQSALLILGVKPLLAKIFRCVVS